MSEYLDNIAREGGAANPIDYTGFGENISERAGVIWRENLLSSQPIYDEYGKQKQAVMNQYGDGQIPPEVVEQHKTYDNFGHVDVDHDALMRWSNRYLGTHYMSKEEADEITREDLKAQRETAEDVFARQNTMGFIGDLAGNVTYAADPFLAPTMVIGLGAGANAANFLTRAAIVAGTEAGIETAAELVRQPAVLDWKASIGAEYSLADAVSEVVAAGLGAGVMGATISTVADGLKALVRKGRKIDGPNAKAATKQTEYTLYEAEQAPDPDMDPVEHFGNIETQSNRIDNERLHENQDPDPMYEAKGPDETVDAEFEDPDANINIPEEDAWTGEVRVRPYGEAIEEYNAVEADLQKLRDCIS